jgi:hypothetical protein
VPVLAQLYQEVASHLGICPAPRHQAEVEGSQGLATKSVHQPI